MDLWNSMRLTRGDWTFGSDALKIRSQSMPRTLEQGQRESIKLKMTWLYQSNKIVDRYLDPWFFKWRIVRHQPGEKEFRVLTPCQHPTLRNITKLVTEPQCYSVQPSENKGLYVHCHTCVLMIKCPIPFRHHRRASRSKMAGWLEYDHDAHCADFTSPLWYLIKVFMWPLLLGWWTKHPYRSCQHADLDLVGKRRLNKRRCQGGDEGWVAGWRMSRRVRRDQAKYEADSWTRYAVGGTYICPWDRWKSTYYI